MFQMGWFNHQLELEIAQKIPATFFGILHPPGNLGMAVQLQLHSLKVRSTHGVQLG